LRDFKNILKTHNYWDDSRWAETDKIYTFETGSQIEFFGADQSDKLRGSRRDRGFMNECNNLSLEIFDEFEVRTKEFLFLDWNPTVEFWFYSEILVNRAVDTDHIILTYKDNEACPEEIATSIEARKNRPGWWKVYGLGLLGEVEGRIYTGWKTDLDEIPHEARLERYGLDFGYTNDPTAIVAVYYLNGSYILDEITYQNGLSNKNIAEIFKNLPVAPIVADSAEPKSIDEIRGYGLSVLPAKKGPDSVRYGIKVVQDQKITVTKRSVNLIKEYRNYLWAMDRNGQPMKPPVPESGNDHGLDACRYSMVTLFPIITRREFAESIIPIHREAKKNPAR
jgi:phage terminase large subunit